MSGTDETAAEFGARLRDWIQEHLADADQSSWTDADRKRTSAALYDAGFLGVTWPVEYGGGGKTADYQTQFNQAMSGREWTAVTSAVTVGICAATLLDAGSEEQKRHYIPRMLRGDDNWTQLLSEPGAGSDLGGVITKAVLDGDQWRIDGQKVWTSDAKESDYAIALVRTDPDVPKYAGVSMIIVPMKSAGVDVRPLRQMSGDSHFNEVFLDNVRVPEENLVGALNDGWAVLNRMLFHERMSLSAGTNGAIMARDGFADLLALARRRGIDHDPTIRHMLGEIYLQNRLLEYMGVRMREAAQDGAQMGPVGSIGKIGVARLARLTGEAGVLIGGEEVIAIAPGDEKSESLAKMALYFPMVGIAGGTTEIQKNTVAERVMQLPREPRRDRDTPFRDLPKNAARGAQKES